jgi:hypothetical protein
MDTRKEFEALIVAAMNETGVSLAGARSDLAAYMAERATHLSLISGEAGFNEAVTAERDNVALRAGLNMSDQATGMEQRFIGIIAGALRIAALSLA